ncbi:MAG: tyrosine/phenylalanine carboxypeptidase domain-containing protein [Candidatus Saccharibacteria bacterium]
MNQNKKTDEEIESYKNTNSDFGDYANFEDEEKRREVERYSFINNIEYTPDFKYPRLDVLIDNKKISKKKTRIIESVLELEAAKNNPNANTAELELYASFHELRLKKILLVEAARNLCNPIICTDYEINRASFAKLNEETYGEFNKSLFLGIMDTEKNLVAEFEPLSELERSIKDELSLLFSRFETEGEKEEILLDEASMAKLHNFVMKRYSTVLEAIPDTPDDVYYDASQCAEIMNNTLIANGLFDLGWSVVVDSKKSTVSTSSAIKLISLPGDTRRNASELRRLVVHEEEVHARRGQNGIETELDLLKLGTANYTDIEEGLGVILECAISGNLDSPSFNRARDRYITAGLAIGVDGRPRDARETYEVLWRVLAIRRPEGGVLDEEAVYGAKLMAYKHIENAFRGTQFWMRGVIYTKLKIYYEGLVKNAEFFREHIDTLDSVFDDLFIGKYDHTSRSEKALVKAAIEHKKLHKKDAPTLTN